MLRTTTADLTPAVDLNQQPQTKNPVALSLQGSLFVPFHHIHTKEKAISQQIALTTWVSIHPIQVRSGQSMLNLYNHLYRYLPNLIPFSR